MILKNTDWKRQPLKTVFYLSFMLFIVIPILIVLAASLLLLNQQFKKQSIENIRQAQETVITEIRSDIDIMSMRLSHLIYTNNNEVLDYAAGTDTFEGGVRYEYGQKLSQAANLALEPVKDVIAVGFYMKDGRVTYIKNDINRTREAVMETSWYQAALLSPNTVCVGSYDTKSMNDLFTGGKKDLFVLVFALAPDVTTDRSEKIEMVTFYQSTDAADRIKTYNTGYLSGKNKMGVTQITDGDGKLIFSTEEDSGLDLSNPLYTCVRTPMKVNEEDWYIESYIRTSDLTGDYRRTATFVLCAAVAVLALAGYYSRYFLRSIVRPIQEISSGLRLVEEGNLEVHIEPAGQYEVRNMIHLFNAMVRRLKVLIDEYKERVRSAERTPQDYLAAMVKGELPPEEVGRRNAGFFTEHYAVLGFHIEGSKSLQNEHEESKKLSLSFERNSRFAARCVLYPESPSFFLIYYRITEDDYVPNVVKMSRELQRAAEGEFGVEICVCIGREASGHEQWADQVGEIRRKMILRHLEGEKAVIDLNKKIYGEDGLTVLAGSYEKLADALYTADEKNMLQEREKLFAVLADPSRETVKMQIYAAILAVAGRFDRDNSNFFDVFGQKFNYIEKLERIGGDTRALKLWLTNYFAWIMDYSASKLEVAQTDVIVRAKRYMADNFENAELSLVKVAEYVGLNEKYFTNRFTKETGETFTAYLTQLRMQKARELLRTTSFKIYEVAELCGYRNAEHFNRMFKKTVGVSPSQYRKTGDFVTIDHDL